MHRKIIITYEVWEEIKVTIGNINPEAGGILGRQNEKIMAYYFDRSGLFLKNKYIPDIKQINKVITNWAECNISFCGFIHSHPLSCIKPSYGDIEFVKKILRDNGLEKLYILIYLADLDEKIVSYELYRNGKIYALDFEIN